MGKIVKIIKFLFFVQKVSSIFRGLYSGTRIPPKWGPKGRRAKRGGSFFSFSIENEKENGKKYFVHL